MSNDLNSEPPEHFAPRRHRKSNPHLLARNYRWLEATALGRLRRFARLLTGSQRLGDIWTKRAIDATAMRYRSRYVALDEASLVELFRTLLDAWSAEPIFEFEPPPHTSDAQQRALQELGLLDNQARAIYAVTWVEDFDRHEVARIFGTSEDAAASLADLVDPDAVGEPRSILVVGDTPLVQRAMTAINMPRLDYSLALGRSDVAAFLSDTSFDIVLVDAKAAELAVDEAVLLLENSGAEPIWIASDSATDLQVASVYDDQMVAREFDDFELEDLVRETLFILPNFWVEPDQTYTDIDQASIDEEPDARSLAPVLAPIDAEVFDGRLRLASSDLPDAALALEGLDAIREQHLGEARWQADQFRQRNGEPRVQRHLDALVAYLAQGLTDQGVLRLTVAVDGMARQLSTIEAEMMPLAASDIASLITGLQQYINQFPISRQYRAEAAVGRPITPAEEEALREIAEVIVTQSPEVVSPELTEQLVLQERARAQQAGSAVGDVARVSSLSNIVKAPARWVAQLGKDLGKEIRKLAIEGIAALVVGLAGASALHFLAIAFPEQFAAVYILLTRAKKQMDDAGLGGGEEKD